MERSPKWDKWRSIPNVEIWEAVALSLNIEPDTVRHSDTSWMAEHHMFDESEQFRDRIDIALRNLDSNKGLEPVIIRGDAAASEVRLADFARWATSVRWSIPTELEALADGTVRDSEKPLSGKARISALKIIITAAIIKYRFDPGKTQNPAVRNIYDDIRQLGMNLDMDTIRRWLDEAAEVTLEHGRHTPDKGS